MVASSTLLSTDGLTVRYGNSVALSGITLDIRAGEAVALLGANGAGKTTLLNTISGFLRSVAGSVRLAGESISGLSPHQIVRRGIVQVSQTRDLFVEMTVLDNLELGATLYRTGIEEDFARVFKYFPRLDERRRQRVGTLSGGEQQMVAIGRALMTRPRILMLDEPSGGLAPRFVEEIANIVSVLKAEGSTMLIVEQNIALALGVADRLYVLRNGHLARTDTATDLCLSPLELARKYYL